MKKFVALLLAVLMVASLCACGQKDTQTGSDIKTVTAGKLTMSTNAQFPPYESVADDGKGYEGTGFEGIDIEIAYALAQKLGLELVVDDMDFDSALSAVQTGKSDIVAAGVTVTPERQNTMCFTDSYANGVQVVIVKEGSDIKTIDDLEGKQIGTQRGTTGYSYCIDDYGEDSVVPFDDGATAVQGRAAVQRRMRELEQKQKEHQSTVKEDAAYSTFQIINEMLCRGIELLPVDLYKSDAKKFLVEDGKIRLPFSSLPGVGEAAAHSLYEACTGGEEFISIDEVQSRAKVSSAVIDVLKSAGALQGLPDSSQTSLF